MSAVTVLIALAVMGYVIYQQVAGAMLNGKRVVILPAVLVIIGIVNVTGHKAHATSTDYAFIAASAAISVAIGLTMGAITRLQSRGGYLWGQMPKSGLWLWAAFIGARVAIMFVAHLDHATVAAGTDAILLSLGLNRAAQAAVIVPRAIALNIPFAPDKDGKSFGASWFGRQPAPMAPVSRTSDHHSRRY